MTLEEFIQERIKRWRQRYEFSDGMVEAAFHLLASDLRSDLRACARKTMEAISRERRPVGSHSADPLGRLNDWFVTDSAPTTEAGPEALPGGTRERSPEDRGRAPA
jgi:hypothetical protein